MKLIVFDVARGSSKFIISPTGKTELVDLGSKADFSPLDHIYRNYITLGERIDRLVLTHHHGDHLDDVYKLTKDRMPRVVLRRKLTGDYESACKESNQDDGQKKAKYFDGLFSTWDTKPSLDKTNPQAWGISRTTWNLSEPISRTFTSTSNAMANCCSHVILYNHNETKFLLCGDMETEGMDILLALNPDMKTAIAGVNVLVAPHHGHSSGFSTELMNAIGKPDVVIASVQSGNPNVETRYSSEDFVKGVTFDDNSTKRLLTTRNNGAITLTSYGSGVFGVQTFQN